MIRIILASFLTLAVISGLLFFGPFSDLYDNSNGDPGIKITLAPIHKVDVRIAESYPEQIFVYIKGGLSDGCTTFNDIQTEINGNIINITITVQRPKDAICAQVYGYFEKDVALGSDFKRGVTYTV
ncbi:MAG: hypothetical protein PHE15_02940, partial [Dehalococcoidales bacterium]|nr:hypothetical protein [Dehalococcoidales bacterium]